MKKILVIIDGMEDICYKELNGLTPLAYANCVQLHKLKTVCKIQNTQKGAEPESLTCILHLLGVSPQFFPKGRAFVEAVANGIQVNENDLVLRCNTVSVDNGKLVSSCLNTDMMLDTKYPIYYIGQYRSIMVIPEGVKYFPTLKTYPPHQNIGRGIREIISSGNALGDELGQYSLSLLKKHKTMTVIPWSPSVPCVLPQFQTLHGCRGAIVCQADVVRGIGRLMDMVCPEIEGATGDIDTNLKGKAQKTLDLIQDFDFVALHINGTDEISHRRDPIEKARFISKIDREVIGEILKKRPVDCEMIVTSDHATIAETGKHSSIEVTCWQG